MEYVRQNTSLPVPKVYCAFKRNGTTYIVMQRLKGHKLAIGWKERSEVSKSRILEQVRVMVEEMRGLKSPHGGAVASVTGGSLYDQRLPGLAVTYPVKTSPRFGPFDDIRAFHRWLRRPVVEAKDSYDQEINHMIAAHETTDWGSSVFTHGDLSSLNILVQGEAIVGIIDWETSGWFPAYWEYTTASQVNPRNLMWSDYIDRFLEPRPDDWRMEQTRLRYFGDT